MAAAMTASISAEVGGREGEYDREGPIGTEKSYCVFQIDARNGEESILGQEEKLKERKESD